MDDAVRYPEGIGPEHEVRPASPVRTWWPLIALAAVLLLALSGRLGGGPNPVVTAASGAGTLSFKAPQILRNGTFFEMQVTMAAREEVAEPVLAISADYLRDLTINSMIPAPTDEGFADGYYTFTFAPLAPGEAVAFKIDGQVNPPLIGRNRGVVEWREGERAVASLDAALLVLP